MNILTLSMSSMGLSELLTAVSTVGFPIVCCGVMFWQSRENSKLHKEESDKWSEALMNNTVALQKLTDMLDKGDR